jgi:hypothetical protein
MSGSAQKHPRARGEFPCCAAQGLEAKRSDKLARAGAGRSLAVGERDGAASVGSGATWKVARSVA